MFYCPRQSVMDTTDKSLVCLSDLTYEVFRRVDTAFLTDDERIGNQ